jgi:hypothetical protein
MVRKLIALFVLAAFMFFNASCVSLSGGRGSTSSGAVSPYDLGPKASEAKIVHVVLKSGQNISFPPKEPGRVSPGGGAIIGTANQMREFAQDDIQRALKDDSGKTLEIETKDGQVFKVLSTKRSEDRTLYSVYGPITIPFADIHQVWLKGRTSGGSGVAKVAMIGGLICLAGGVVLALTSHSHESPNWPPDESCPFVYAWNGEEYVLDAEMFGAAISEGFKRTDWVELSELREANGKYRVLLANELEETDHTDELKLVAVDHAPGVKVAPDLAGGFHTFSDPHPPMSAVDQKTGRDILAFVGANDRAFWLSDLEGRDPDGVGDFRDELIFEFPKPAGAKQAKLLANVWTTAWGSRSGGMFLEHYGTSLPVRYAEVDGHGPFYFKYMSWVAAEELGVLKVWVETPAGWQARSMMVGGAPAITKDKAYLLAVGDLPGETLRIKLRPPVNFWMVNSLAVDYGEASAVVVSELAAEKAVDHTGRDVREVLASTDRSYLVSPNPGEWTELEFTAPPLKEGLVRTVFVKASGYYKVHVDDTGEPRLDLAERILTEPGFAARYSFSEYLKWEAGLRAGAAAAKR